MEDKNKINEIADFSDIDINDISINSIEDNKESKLMIDENGFFNNLDDFSFESKLNIKILGIGGAGNNMIEHMAKNSNLDPTMLYAINTDYQVLKKMSNLPCSKVLIGKKTTSGYGSGSDPLIGQKAADEDRKIITDILKGVDLLFIVSGMGKGTGTGASPIVAEIAKELNILTIAISNIPSLQTEGKIIFEKGLIGIENLKKYVDGLATINNDKILGANIENESLYNCFKKVNQVICETITDLINTVNVPSHINIDFNDIKNFFMDKTNFQITNCEFESNENSKEILKQKICSTLFEDKIINSPKAILTLRLNPNVPSTFVADIRKVIEELTENNNLQLTYAVDYSDQISFAKISILIATNYFDALEEQQLNKVENDNLPLQEKTIESTEIKVDEIQTKITPPPPPIIEVNKNLADDPNTFINQCLDSLENLSESIQNNCPQNNQTDNKEYHLNEIDSFKRDYDLLQTELNNAKTNLQNFANTKELSSSIKTNQQTLNSTALNKFVSKTLSLFKNNNYNKENER